MYLNLLINLQHQAKMTTSYDYTVYYENGDIDYCKKSKPFKLNELQAIVGGRIQILATRDPHKLTIVCEDGAYTMQPNPCLPFYFGTILVADQHLIE
jgi:hypothetical protein